MKRMNVQDYQRTSFLMVPNLLFKGQYSALNNNDRMLYSKMLNRWEWSFNNHWVDADGAVYFYYTQRDLQTAICVDRKTVVRCIQRLKLYGLLEEVPQGKDPKTGKLLPSIYYLGLLNPGGKMPPGQEENQGAKCHQEPGGILTKNQGAKCPHIKTYNTKKNNNKDREGFALSVANAPDSPAVVVLLQSSHQRTPQTAQPATAQSEQGRYAATEKEGCANPSRPTSQPTSYGDDTASSMTEPRPTSQSTPSNVPHSRMAADNDAEARMVAAVLISEFHAAPRVVAGWLKRYDLDRIKRNANYTVNLAVPPDDPVKYLSAAIRDDYAACRTATETQAAADLAAIEAAGRELQAALAADC